LDNIFITTPVYIFLISQTLKTNACDHSVWNDVAVLKAVQTTLDLLEKQPFLLPIGGTIIEDSANILIFVLNCTIMPSIVAPIASMDTAWLISYSLFLYIWIEIFLFFCPDRLPTLG
jgi:hypothetical protein